MWENVGWDSVVSEKSFASPVEILLRSRPTIASPHDLGHLSYLIQVAPHNSSPVNWDGHRKTPPVSKLLYGHYSEKLTRRDRKSTRLNSSHVKSSYALFC